LIYVKARNKLSVHVIREVFAYHVNR